MDEIFVMDTCGNDDYYKEPEPFDSMDITETDDESEYDDDDMVIDDILYDDSDDDDSDDSDYVPSDDEDIEVIRENKKRILKSILITLSKKHKQE